MIKRHIHLPLTQSFFLFGARNTGKSTWIQHLFPKPSAYWIDLLDPEQAQRFTSHPKQLAEIVAGLPAKTTHIVIDEIQKSPALLDVVHHLIETTEKHFVLTGSSARKLKRGAANLLAGRALAYHFYPFSYLELQAQFDLQKALHYGMLPYVYHLKDDRTIQRFLVTYTQTYLKEEIWAEQVIRNVPIFRKFLEVAAQNNGKVINFANISRDLGIADTTVREYYHILEDTLIGFYLEPYHTSLRKRVSKKPKFYLFDVGITRALKNTVSVPLQKRTIAYGDTFEHFIILECMKLADLHFLQYRFTYFQTKDGAEVDLIVEQPGQPILLIEINSGDNVAAAKLNTLQTLSAEITDCEAICLSNDPHVRKVGNVTIYPWHMGIKKYFTPKAN